MLFKAKLLAVLAALAITGCSSGGPASSDQPKATVTKAQFQEELHHGFMDPSVKRRIEAKGKEASSEDVVLSSILDCDYGKYYTSKQLKHDGSGVDREGYFVIDERKDGTVVYEYREDDTGWNRAVSSATPETIYENERAFLSMNLHNSFDSFTFNADLECYDLTEAITIDEVVYTSARIFFNRGKMGHYYATFTANEVSYTLDIAVSDTIPNGGVSLPDGFVPSHPGEVPPSTGQVDKTTFERQAIRVGESDAVSGTGHVRYEVKQNNRVSQSGDTTYAYTYNSENKSWSYNRTASTGTEVATYRTVYNHTLYTYAAFIKQVLNAYEDILIKYYFKQDGYRIEITCKMDYPNPQVTGKLNANMIFEWDLHGMITKWYLSLNGNLTYNGQNINYAEVNDITASWNY